MTKSRSGHLQTLGLLLGLLLMPGANANTNPMGLMAMMMMDAMMQMMTWMIGGQSSPYSSLGMINPMGGFSQNGLSANPLGYGGQLPYGSLSSLYPGSSSLLGLNALASRSPMSLLGLSALTPQTNISSLPGGGIEEEESRDKGAIGSGYSGIDGIWSAPSGEYWAVRSNQFIFFGLSGLPMKGEYAIRGDWIIANSYPQEGRGSVSIQVQFRQMDDLLLLRNRKGQVTLLQRQFDPDRRDFRGGLQ